jgi:curved DNA-binding protein CbpA
MLKQQMQQQQTQKPRRMEDFLFERGNMDRQQQQMTQYQDHPSRMPMNVYPQQEALTTRKKNGWRDEMNENSSEALMRRDFETFRLTPHQFHDEIEEYQKQQENEKREFEEEERKRRNQFDEYMKRKSDHLQKEIQRFEENYNPFEILGLPQNHYVSHDVKKAYKKMALKYHPDKAGEQYAEHFQLITQSYIYLLNKCEQQNEMENKMSRPVTKQEYVDDVNEVGVENIYVNKDKFNISQFNQIFEQYHSKEEEMDGGYGDLYQQKDQEVGDGSALFDTKFSKEIFNANFDKLKKNKKNSTDVIEYYEPEAMISSNVGYTELGRGRLDDYTGQSSVQYTDYKKAHMEENVLIDPSRVKHKEYRNVDQLKTEREGMNFQPTQADTLRQQAYARMRAEKEEERLSKLREQEERMEKNYRKINQRLIVHK